MEASPTLAILVIIFPLIAAVGMIWFMMSGKGKPAPTQDEILAVKRQRKEENHSSE
jgi:hypothetical protein